MLVSFNTVNDLPAGTVSVPLRFHVNTISPVDFTSAISTPVLAVSSGPGIDLKFLLSYPVSACNAMLSA